MKTISALLLGVLAMQDRPSFPDVKAPTVRQASSPMPPACPAIAAPILPTVRNGPFIARSMKS